MHELSLCSAIASTVRDHADGRPVRSVRLRIGHLRQVVPDTLRFCWTMQEGELAQAELGIEEVPAVVRCSACDLDSTLDSPVLVCPQCGTGEVTLLSGEEFLIESIDVEAEVG